MPEATAEHALSSYLPMDRRQALAIGASLPDRAQGSALFADISGFTPLTEALTTALGPRRGAEELTRQLNQVYDGLIAEVERYHGSVIDFSGDAITCWFDEVHGPAPVRAVACAQAIQAIMRQFASVPLPDGSSVPLAVKVSVATGPARRFSVGCSDIQLLDALAGVTLERMAQAEHLARKGEVIVDGPTAAALGKEALILGWRMSRPTVPDAIPESFAVLRGLRSTVAEDPWPSVATDSLRESVVRPWLLPAVYERLRDGLGEFLTELRPVVATFVRFEGIDYDGDEAAGAKLDAYICWAQRVLARYAGTLVQVGIGDKGSYIYAAFGLALAHEDDARRAVGVALELAAPPPELSFIRPPQIGISQGTMRTGAYGGSTRRAYGALGNEVNLAARLMQFAAPGQIIASQRVHQAVTEGFVWEALPPAQVKGKSEAIEIFRLLTRQEARAVDVAYTGALIGREAELETLTHFLEPILSGQFAGLAYVFGEPGIGKSRIVYELRRMLGPAGGTGNGAAANGAAPIHWFTCPAEGILRQSLHPFKSFLRTHLDQSAEAAEAANKGRFDQIVDGLLSDLQAPGTNGAAQSLSDELARTRSHLGAMVDLFWEASPYQEMDPKQRFENTLAGFRALILAESLRQPVVLCIENAHWLDTDSRELLRRLVQGAGPYPFAVVFASRYGDDGGRWALEVEPPVPQQVVELGTLADSGVRELAAQVMAGSIADRLAEFLAEKTDGNPFFVEQLALDLRERGLITCQQSEGRPLVYDLDVSDQNRAEEVPVSINAVLVARLDRLAAQVKAVVQTAAVLGHEFEVRVLTEMLQRDANLVDKVKQAEAQAIWSPLSEIRYLFKHALLRDAAYDMQLLERLRELHRTAGITIEALYTADLAPHAADLAYHFGRAGDEARERRYARLAGEHAAQQFANAEAVTYLSRALELTPADEQTERYDLLLLREQTNNLQGARSAQAADLEALSEASRQLNDSRREAEVALRLANYYEGISDYPAAVLAARQAVSIARAGGAVTAEAAGQLRWGVALWRQADYAQSRAHLELALSLARKAGLSQLQADALRHLGNVAYPQGDYAGARAFGEQARQLKRQTGARFDESSTMANLGNVAGYIEDYGSARTRLEQDLTLLRQVGNRRGESGTLSNLGYVCIYQGDYSDAGEYLEKALQLKRDIADRRGEGTVLTYLGLLAIQQENFEAAAGHCRQALEVTQGLGARSAQGYALTTHGQALIGLGRLAEAAEAYQQAVALRRELREHHLALESLAGLARVFLVQGDVAVAHAMVEEILVELESGGLDRTNEPIRLYLTCYQVLHADSDSRSRSVLEIGYKLLQSRAAKFGDEAMRAKFLENVPAHRELMEAWAKEGTAA